MRASNVENISEFKKETAFWIELDAVSNLTSKFTAESHPCSISYNLKHDHMICKVLNLLGLVTHIDVSKIGSDKGM